MNKPGNVYEGEGAGGTGLEHGFGKMKYANGDISEGKWNHGDKHGTGKFTWKNGDVYEGEGENGAIQGKICRCDYQLFYYLTNT